MDKKSKVLLIVLVILLVILQVVFGDFLNTLVLNTVSPFVGF